MNQKVTIIETKSALDKYIPLMHNAQVKGCDIETTGLDPYTSNIRTLQFTDEDNTLVLDVKKIGKEATREAVSPFLTDPTVIKCFHNAKFDLKFLKHDLDIDVEGVFDSYIASLLVEAGIRKPRGYHGLEQTAARIADITISKDEQRSDWSGELSTSQLQYAAKDAQVLLPVRKGFIEKLVKLGLVRCAKLEFDAVLPVAWLELCGFYLDFEEWLALANDHRAKAQDWATKIYKELDPFIPQGSLFEGTGFNLNSTDQIMDYFTRAGVPMPASTKEWELTPLRDKYKLVDWLLEYRGNFKASNSFGESWREFVNPMTGRIHANFSQLGAETGRMAVSNPNINQIPADEAHRSCFKAEGDNTLVSADYSQIELRILADLAKDKNAIQAFRSGADFHMSMAAIAFKKKLEDVTPDERTFAKRLNFGIPYGLGVRKFAFQCNISEAEAQIIMNDYFAAVPNEKRWLMTQKAAVLVRRYARTASGRMARYEFDENDGMQRSMAQRNACNLPIQGTAADILKRALRLVYDAFKPYQDKVKLVNVVHDQIDLETATDFAKDAEEILTTNMIKASEDFILEAPIKVDSKINRVWKK